MTDGRAHMDSSSDARKPTISGLTVVIVAVIALVLMIGLPLFGVFHLNRSMAVASGLDFWGPVIAIMVSVTSMSVSGIFVFMSFRIDRGVENTTRETVRKVLIKEMKKLFKDAGEDAKKYFKTAKASSDRAFATLQGEVRDMKKGVDATQKMIAEEVATTMTTIGNARESVTDEFEQAVKRMQQKCDEEAEKLDKYFSGVYDLITALREQILASSLTATTTNGDVTLQWTPGPDPDSKLMSWEYQMRESDGDFGDWLPIPPEAVPERKHVVQGLPGGRDYVFRLRARSHDTAQSNEATVRLDDDGDGEPDR